MDLHNCCRFMCAVSLVNTQATWAPSQALNPLTMVRGPRSCGATPPVWVCGEPGYFASADAPLPKCYVLREYEYLSACLSDQALEFTTR